MSARAKADRNSARTPARTVMAWTAADGIANGRTPLVVKDGEPWARYLEFTSHKRPLSYCYRFSLGNSRIIRCSTICTTFIGDETEKRGEGSNFS